MNTALAVLAGGLVPFIVGSLWYSKALFGNVWMRELGKTEEDIKQGNMAVTFGLSFVMALVIAWGFVRWTHQGEEDPTPFLHGMYHGLFECAVLVVPALITVMLYEQKSFRLIMINVGYWIVNIPLIVGVAYLVYHAFPAAEEAAEPEALNQVLNTVKTLV